MKKVCRFSKWLVSFCGLIVLLLSCHKSENISPSGNQTFKLTQATLDGKAATGQLIYISTTPSFVLSFSEPLDETSANSTITFSDGTPIKTTFSNNDSTVTVQPASPLKYLTSYSLAANSLLKSKAGHSITIGGFSISFQTQMNLSYKFPILSDSSLIDLVQQQTLKYFYDFAESNSGMARERNTSGTTVTTGGSGFGMMAIVVGINRGWISRSNGVAHVAKVVSYLETADRFHGAWSHWSDGSTGKVVPFASNDDGADIVETSYMIHGLLCVRQYLNSSDTVGNNLINRITKLYDAIEWNWFRKPAQENVLYWNWSPNYDFAVNVPVRGYNETLITYILAAGSSTSAIPVEVYQQGWAQSGSIKNGNTYYGHVLPLGQPYGGPLFFTQYSFLGFNPHVTDSYLNVNYWTQNVNQSLINHDYCKANPQNYLYYSDSCWGLTASDISSGYGAQSPTNDNGTISPTAAIASMPYTPTESMKAIRFFYYIMGDRLWGSYGFYDAFNLSQNWVATSTLAIDQGPIVVMLENYRTQLLWKLFMSAPEVKTAQTKLGIN